VILLNGNQVKPTIFPDKTSQVWKLPEEDLECFSASITWKFENEGEFMHLAQLAHLLQARGVLFEIHLLYLPYARQDKLVANNRTFALHTFIRLLKTLGAKRVVLYDPHNAQPLTHGLETVVKVVNFASEAKAALKECGANLWCFPDGGAAQRYESLFREPPGSAVPEVPSVAALKRRDQATGALTETSLPAWQLIVAGLSASPRVMMVDDICDGGATFIALAKVLQEHGAEDVFLFVSHGIFSRGLQPLFDAGISRVFTPEGEAL
jgi:ribose-phosphate pyrophosphokinase